MRQIRPTHIKGEAAIYDPGQETLGVKEDVNKDAHKNEESVSKTNLEKIPPHVCFL